MHRICQHCAIRIGGDIMVRDKVSTDILWKDRKRILFLGLPWSFTRYSVSKDRFFISKGFDGYAEFCSLALKMMR